MKRLFLPVLLTALGATRADAHGLYFGIGYGVSGNPKASITRGACPASYVGWNGYIAPDFGMEEYNDACYFDPARVGNDGFEGGFDYIFGDIDNGNSWPTYIGSDDWVYENYDPAEGAVAWNPGDTERNILKPTGTKSYTIAAGWDFPKSPFRVEFEIGKTEFKSNEWDLEIQNTNTNGVNRYAGIPSIGGTVSGTFDTMMLNILFEIPVSKDIDPYIGLGVGRGKLDLGPSGGSSSLDIQQYILGVEYRFPETPYIVGIEYRTMKIPTIAEKDNSKFPFYGLVGEDVDSTGVGGFFPTIDGAAFLDYSHSQIMLKFRYDFISNDF
ncbi:MAG: porin family protein [Rickettsiales bacterium]|nr:porin family protein [Rickettsiales bacterium]